MVNNKAIRQGLYLALNVASVNATLATSNGASIFHSVAPQESRYPLLVFFKTSAITTSVFGVHGYRASGPGLSSSGGAVGEAYKDHIWTIKGVANNTRAGEAEDIDKAVNDVLQHGIAIVGTDDGFANAESMLCARIGDVEYTEVVGDNQYRHCGGNYRLVIQDST